MSWKQIIKQSELIPFPPGSGGAEEESWMFPYDINETFVQSPRNRRRVSADEPQRPANWTRKLPHKHEGPVAGDLALYHLIDQHGVGVQFINQVNIDHPEIGKLIHDMITH